MKMFRLDCPTAKQGNYRINIGGGVCTYVHEKWLPYCSVVKLGTLSTKDFEILSLTVEKPNFIKHFFVISVYKPMQGDSFKCVKLISDIMSNKRNCAFLILGHFNIDLLKYNIPSTKKILNTIRSLDLTQLIKTLTRPSATCIDWIMTNSEYVAMNYVSNNLSTDHYPGICVHKKAR